jgi:hypothetical protein
MSIGEKWEMFWSPTGQWRLAKIVNELGDQVELKFQDVPSRGLAETISTTRQAMSNKAAFRRK